MDAKIQELVGLKPPPTEIFEFQLNPGLTQDREQRGVKGQGGFYFPDNERTSKEGYRAGEGCFEYFREYEGQPAPLFPMVRIPFWDTINLLGPIKRQLSMVFKFLGSKEARAILIVMFFMGKKWRGRLLNKLCEMFNDIASESLTYKYLKYEYYSPPVREIIDFIERLLVLLGVSRDNSLRTARTIGLIFENDQAYCWRFLDVMTGMDKKELIENLPKTAQKMMETLLARDATPENMVGKYAPILKIIKYGWMLPSLRKSVQAALRPLNIENCALTENDIYHTLMYYSYNVQGKTPEERLKIYEGYHGTDGTKWPARWSLG